MMRIWAFLLLLAPQMRLRANVIDQLQTRQDVEKFLVHKVSKEFKDEAIFGARPGRDSAAMPEWFYKIDLDGNGLTDLVINGLEFIVVMDRGDEGYQVRDLGKRHWEKAAIALRGIDSVGSWKGLVVRDKVHARQDTLVYHFGEFIEYNAFPLEHFGVESIRFAAGGCFGTCPIFELRIAADGHLTYHAQQYNHQKGDFAGVIPSEDLEKLKTLLAYLPLDRLDSTYSVNWTDDQTVWLEVHYNGRVKRISDYGAIGSRGLSLVYGLLFALRDKVDWEIL